jgi:hypothetical protein
VKSSQQVGELENRVRKELNSGDWDETSKEALNSIIHALKWVNDDESTVEDFLKSEDII